LGHALELREFEGDTFGMISVGEEESSENPHHFTIGARKTTGRVGVCATITVVEDFSVDHELVCHDYTVEEK
jgi:hypothetical protein